MGRTRKVRAPVQKRGIETREKLLEAARILFIEKGYYKTHGPEIAAKAGLATGTFYSYFTDKKDILIELFRMFYKHAIEQALSILNNSVLLEGDARTIIREMLRTLYTIHDEQRDIHKALHPLVFMDEEIMELTRREDEKVIELIAFYYTSNHTFLHVNNARAAAELTFRTCDEIIHRILFWGAHTDKERLIEELETMLFKYLFTESPDIP